MFSFLLETHNVDYLTAKKPRLVSALDITGCPIGRLITQHNWKQGTTNFSHLQFLVTGEVCLETRSSCQTDVLAEAWKTVLYVFD